jgi:hypothetical protein
MTKVYYANHRRQSITRYLLAGLIFLLSLSTFAQDSIFIKVHFLYGSKPHRKHRDTEGKWFGGKLGGHVGIETDSNRILDFNPLGKFHYIAKRNDRNSCFAVHTPEDFWEIFGGNAEDMKKTSVVVPLTPSQKAEFDSIYKVYTAQTPYDYAFIGMRCGAAAYDILGKLGIMKELSYRKTYLKIFYPKKLRRRLLKKARKNNWQVIRQEGTNRRKWERE